ncbi:MAG: hypothetical protein S4CHLAM20_00500 [Chlamydiia bacterium]|nr:hypothetical protein [Chlamydiia bacterium]
MKGFKFVLAVLCFCSTLFGVLTERQQKAVEAVCENQELAEYYEEEIKDVLSYTVRVTRDYEIEGYKIKIIYDPNGNYKGSGVVFVDSPLVILFENDCPRKIWNWMWCRIDGRAWPTFDVLEMDKESKSVLYGLKNTISKTEIESQVEKVYQDEELAQYFMDEFIKLSKSKIRTEKDYTVHGYDFRAIYDPCYESGKSGIMFKRKPLAILFKQPSPKKIMDWVSEQATPIKHRYGYIDRSEESMFVLFGVRSIS